MIEFVGSGARPFKIENMPGGTFSIADGLALGFVAYPIVKRLGGKGDDVHPLVDVLAVVFIARYLFMA